MAALLDMTQRISLWSNRLRRVLGAVLIALPLLAIAALLASRSFGGVVYLGDIARLDLSTMPAAAALVASFGALVDLALRLLPLLFLRSLLGFWACGSLLSQASAHMLQLTGITIALGAFGGLVIAPLTSLLVNATTGTETLPMTVGIDLAPLIAGGVIYLVGMVMREAARIAEEAALTI
jgi:hypothetical protein